MADGYRLVPVPADHPCPHRDGRVLEHRLTMELHLDRCLEPHENVHHRNAVRDDNRLANLELWSRAQPSGARVEDLIDYAHWVLTTYAFYEPIPRDL